MNFGENTLQSAYLSAPRVNLITAMKCILRPGWSMNSEIQNVYKKYDSTSGLTMDESAAITLYFDQFTNALTRVLLTKDLTSILSSFGYLRLLHTALLKLPRAKGTFCHSKYTYRDEPYIVGTTITLVNQLFLLSFCSIIDGVQSFLHCYSGSDPF